MIRGAVKLMSFAGLSIIVVGLLILLLKPESVIKPLLAGTSMPAVGMVFPSPLLLWPNKVGKAKTGWDDIELAIGEESGNIGLRVAFAVLCVLVELSVVTGIETEASTVRWGDKRFYIRGFSLPVPIQM